MKKLQLDPNEPMMFYEYPTFYLLHHGKHWWSGGISETCYYRPDTIPAPPIPLTKTATILPEIDHAIVQPHTWTAPSTAILDTRGVTPPGPGYYRSSLYPTPLYRVLRVGKFMIEFEHYNTAKKVFVIEFRPIFGLRFDIAATEIEWIEYKLTYA